MKKLRDNFLVFLKADRGSVLIEFSLLSPLYVMVIMALIYHFALVNGMLDGARSTILAAGTPGEQTVADLPDNYFDESGGDIISGTTNHLELIEEEAEEYFTEDNIFQNLEEMARDPRGYYEMVNGRFEYRIDEDRLSRWGNYIFNNNLQDYSDDVAELMDDTIVQTTATTVLTFHMPALEDPIEIETSSTAVITREIDRGTHEALGETNFNHRAISELFDDSISNHQDRNSEFWSSN